MNIFQNCWLDIFPTFKWILCKVCKTINMLQRTICRWAKIFHWIMCRGIKCLPTKMIIFHDNTITLGYRCHKRLNQMRLGKESPSFLIPVHCWGVWIGGIFSQAAAPPLKLIPQSLFTPQKWEQNRRTPLCLHLKATLCHFYVTLIKSRRVFVTTFLSSIKCPRTYSVSNVWWSH